VPVHRGVGQEDTDLAVLRPPGGAGILPLHPGRPGAFLNEPGLIGDQHPARVPEVLDDVVPHIITDLPGVPVRVAQQPLHPIRADLTSALGQRPPVLAF
jgi:hypothetical protein